MPRIAFCLPALSSHAAVHGALASVLEQRGHQVAMMGAGRLAHLAGRAGVPFLPLVQTCAGMIADEREHHAAAGLAGTLLSTAYDTRTWTLHGPQALARFAPDLVIADQAEPGASLAAEAAGLRRATLASALPMDRDPAVPPPFVGWPFLAGEAGHRRNRGGWRVADALMTLQARALEAGCRDHGLPPRARMSDWISPDLDLRQIVPSLDFPHEAGPGARAVGPLRNPAVLADLDDVPDDGPPLVFASLGTLQGWRCGLLAAICGAAEDLGLRLALAHGGGLTPAQAAALPGDPMVRALWPQQAIVNRAAACITHAGMNTVLDCVAARVPMVAIPLAFEQPAIAARLAHHGVARVLTPRRAGRAAIGAALGRVLSDPAFRIALDRPAAEIAAAGGAPRAADLVEAALCAALPSRARAS